jgi:hypothetical protein
MPDVSPSLATPSVGGWVINPSYSPPGNAGASSSSGSGSSSVTGSVSLSTLLNGEDPTLARMLQVNGVKVSPVISTNGSTLIQSGKTIFLGLWCLTAGTSWTAAVRDNPSAAAGGTTKGAALPLTANANPFQAILGEKGMICDTGLVIDTAGTAAGTLVALYL